jgi:hypothetical protein
MTVNAMLLNEFLKEHHRVQEQDAIIRRQQSKLKPQTTRQREMARPSQTKVPERTSQMAAL